jgi:hypothetical protein
VALTTLDPKPALVVIDLQKGLMAVPTVHRIEEIVGRATRLAGPTDCSGYRCWRRQHLLDAL